MRRISIGVAILTLLAAGSGRAQVIANHLTISQVYGGGGNAGAPFQNDFIELFNPTAADVPLTGWSVQYAPAGSSTWQVTPLSGTIPAGTFFLIHEASGGGNGVPLPMADTVGTIIMSATAGKVALVNNSTGLIGPGPTGTGVIDFVGYGTANAFEGTGPAPAPSNTTSVQRQGIGAIDTDNNATDFFAAAPIPRNSAVPEPTSLALVGLAGAAACSRRVLCRRPA